MLEIMERTDIAEADFISVIAPLVPERTLSATKDYLGLIFKPGADESLVRDLNPLEKIETTIQPHNGSTTGETKNLEFKFKKLNGSEEKMDYLVKVRDVTQQVKLANQLRESELKTKNQTEMLLSILHVGPELLADFIEAVENELGMIQDILKEDASGESYSEKLVTIFRCAHSIKGNAALLDLKFFARRAHEFEDMISQVQQRKNLCWNDFLPLALELARLQQSYKDMQALTERITKFQSDTGRVRTASDLIGPTTEKMVERLAEETGKKVRFLYKDFEGTPIPTKYSYMLRDVLVQLTRNSLAHGIEEPQVRVARGKPEEGTIELSARNLDDGLEIRYRDDGRGLQTESIKEKAIEMGLVSQAETATMDRTRLVKLIFEPGFSTSRDTTQVAGRGMGMDIIRKRLMSAHRSLSVRYETDKFIEFKCKLPH